MNEGTLHAVRALVIVVLTALLIRVVGEMVHAPDEQKAEPPAVASTNATPDVTPDPAAAAEPPVVAADGALSNQGADSLVASLQPDGAIPNAAILTFKNRAAYDAFLKRAAASGLVVTGRMDALNSLRVAFDNLARLKNDLLEHADDYAQIGANFPVAVPALPLLSNARPGVISRSVRLCFRPLVQARPSIEVTGGRTSPWLWLTRA